MLDAVELETRPGQNVSLDVHQNTMNFRHEASLTPPLRSDDQYH